MEKSTPPRRIAVSPIVKCEIEDEPESEDGTGQGSLIVKGSTFGPFAVIPEEEQTNDAEEIIKVSISVYG